MEIVTAMLKSIAEFVDAADKVNATPEEKRNLVLRNAEELGLDVKLQEFLAYFGK